MKPKLLISLLLFFIMTMQGLSQDGVKPIIDMHLHDFTAESYFTGSSPDGIESPQSLDAFRKETMRQLKKYNVIRAVVSTIGGTNTWDGEGIFISGYYIEAPLTDTTEFIRKIEAGEIEVFGEIGAIYGGYTLSDPSFDAYMSICERYDIPVAVHTGGSEPNITYGCCPNFRLRYGDPFTVEDVIAKYPKLRIYLMHAGEVYHEHAIRLMLQYEQVYVDLGALLWIEDFLIDYAEQFLQNAKKYNLIDRVMYGSDQVVWPHGISKSIETLDSFDFLTEEDKRKILYHNAVRFLRLSEEDLKRD